MGFRNAPSGEGRARPVRVASARLVAVAASVAFGLATLLGCAASAGPTGPADAKGPGSRVERAAEVAGEAGPLDDADASDALDDADAPDAPDQEEPLASAGSGPGAGAPSLLKVRFIDVGQGDCALISCDGQWLLIDAGPPRASSTIYTVFRRLGVTHLDYIVSTHPDADHSGGLSGALEVATCGTFFCPAVDSDTRTWRGVCERLGRQGVPLTTPVPGDGFDLGSARVTFLGPVRAAPDDNNNSLVLRIDHGSDSFLFAGDAERAEESDLLASGANLRADVLKVGHHGSAGASSPEFLAAVAPQYAIIPVGANPYGHPTDEVLGRLSAQGAQVLRTDQEGDVLVVSTGDGVAVTRKDMVDE